MIVGWVLAICVFWIVAALFLGGGPVAIEGGSGPRETGGLLLSFALFLAAYAGLSRLLDGAVGGTGAAALSTLLAAALVPLFSILALRAFGVRVTKASAEDEH